MSNKKFNGWGYTAHKGAGQKMVAILATDVETLGVKNSIKWTKSTGNLPGYAGEVGDFIEDEVFYTAKAADVILEFNDTKNKHQNHFENYDKIVFNGADSEEAQKADSGNCLGSMMFKLA